MDKKKLFFIALICMGVLSGGYRIWQRIQLEKQLNQVEIGMSLDAVKRLADFKGESPISVLSQLKEAGLTSVILDEDTVESVRDNAEATVLSGSEIINLYRIGHINKFLLTHLYNTVKVQPNATYLFGEKRQDFERIESFFKSEMESDAIKQIGGINILEMLDDYEDITKIGLGFSDDNINLIQRAKLAIIPRLKRSPRLSQNALKLKFDAVDDINNVNTILFDNEFILGYPTHKEYLNQKIHSSPYQFGKIEFFNQDGINELANSFPEKLIKVHHIGKDEIEKIDLNKIAPRYVRAVKERGVKLVFFHPILDRQVPENLMNLNLSILNDIKAGIETLGYEIAPVSGLYLENYPSTKKWEAILLIVGLIGGILWFLNSILPLSWKGIGITTGSSLAIGLFLESVLPMTLSAQLFGFISSILFPILAIIEFYPTSSVKKKNFQLGNALLRTLGSIVITSVGILLIIGFLGDKNFLLGLHMFKGVKIAFFIPLVVTAIYFYLRPDRLSSIYYIFHRLFFAPVRTGVILAIFLVFMIGVIFFLRSGNFAISYVPLFESHVRDWLEAILIIRPRTKEFLLGYPILLATFYFLDTLISRTWLWFFMPLGLIGLISLTNTFCHIHTPLSVSLVRSIYGLLIGLCFGIILIGIILLLKRVIKKLS